LFTTLIVQPIFNLLVLIYNIIPGHNFGMAIILFTIVVRILLWPVVKRQLHQTKLMRKLQPEIKEIKKKTKGNKQQESQLMMELYKERGVSMFASFRLLLIQLPILLGLYAGLNKVLKDPHQLFSFAYPWIQNFSWMQELAKDISKFDETLFGFIDLTRPALGPNGVYWWAMLLVAASAAIQYLQSRQLLPKDKEARSLRKILKEAGEGRQADQSEVNAAVSRNTIFLFPALIFFFTVNLASALSLYWLVGGLVAYIQQSRALREDVDEMEEIADKSPKKKFVAATQTNTAKQATKASESGEKRRYGSKTTRAQADTDSSESTDVSDREKQAVEAEIVADKDTEKSKSKKRERR
jgi:YidC/Oxa1 family membrane protein insertase